MDQLKGGPKEPLMMSGPKFGEKRGAWSRFASWTGRNRANVVLSIIGILIIAGGIYLYANYQKTNSPGSLEQEQTTEQNSQGAVTPDQVNLNGQTPQQPAKITPTVIAEVIKYENNNFTVQAGKGAGVTHLARAAAKEYLEAHTDLKTNVTAEHKIYIEDYLMKHTSSSSLVVGQQIQFSDNLIKEAIDQSQKLNQNQLQNLHKYALMVPSLTG